MRNCVTVAPSIKAIGVPFSEKATMAAWTVGKPLAALPGETVASFTAPAPCASNAGMTRSDRPPGRSTICLGCATVCRRNAARKQSIIAGSGARDLTASASNTSINLTSLRGSL